MDLAETAVACDFTKTRLEMIVIQIYFTFRSSGHKYYYDKNKKSVF